MCSTYRNINHTSIFDNITEIVIHKLFKVEMHRGTQLGDQSSACAIY